MSSATTVSAQNRGQIYNINLIVKDYIRILKLPKVKLKKTVVVLLVGIPASGKSYLAKNLAENLPLVLVSENDIQSFLVPEVSFFERGQEIITGFAKQAVKELVKNGYSCLFDANLRAIKTRGEFRFEVEKAGGQTATIFLNCPRKTAYERIRKRNSEIIAGEAEGFPLDWDYFQYEINTTQPPLKAERALTFDSSKPNHQLEKVVSYLKKKINQS